MKTVTATPETAVAAPVYALHVAWNSRVLSVDGFLDIAEWHDAAKLKIPKGVLMAKNDATTLYLALDMTEDLFDDTSGDSFALYFDVDRDGMRTADRDLTFSMPLAAKEGLMRWTLAANGGVWQDPRGPIASTARKSFGPTLNSAKPHVFWEIALKIAEIDPNLFAAAPILRMGVEVSSQNLAHDSWTVQVPQNLEFSRFIELTLAVTTEQTYVNPGAVIAGLGVISAGDIDARTGLGKVLRERDGLVLLNAAFGGVLDFYANAKTMQSLLAAGAKTFIIRARHGANEKELNAASWTKLLTHWTNHRWTGAGYAAEQFAANAKGEYRLIDPAAAYRLAPLLFQWSSIHVPDALYQFEVDFFDTKGMKLDAPMQRLTLHIHNRAPVVQILDILRNDRSDPNRSIPAAESVITLNGQFACLDLIVKAWDTDGFLDGYQATACYGGRTDFILSHFYDVNSAPNAPWKGVKEQAAIYVVPVSAVYAFRVRALGRVTDGYGQILYSETSRVLAVKQPYPDRQEHKPCARKIEPPLQAFVPPVLV